MIVLLSEFFGWNNQLDGNKLVTFSLKSRYNLRNQASLDAVRLDGNEGALHLCGVSLLVLEHVNCSGDGGGEGSPSRGGAVGSLLVVGVGGREGLPAQVGERGERGGAALGGEEGGGGGALGGGEEGPGGGLEQLPGGAHGGAAGLRRGGSGGAAAAASGEEERW